jgi:two-component system, sensor histidine kinase and response regulator
MKKQIILCVDDEPSILESLKIELSRSLESHYLIELAEDGTEALEIIDDALKDSCNVPLLISDYIMPQMRGDELLKQVFQRSPHTLSIMLTGQADAQAIGNAVNYGNLYRYISKPWDRVDLSMTVKEALYKYHQSRQIERFYSDLEDKIAQRTQELCFKNQKLTELNREKNEFLSMVVHDLKNPLSAIEGLANLIYSALESKPADLAEIYEYTTLIETSAHQMFALVTNLLDVSAIESGKFNMSMQQVDVVSLLRKVMTQNERHALSKSIQLHLHHSEPVVFVRADANMLNQIFDNLISNAIKYSPFEQHVDIRINASEYYIRCEVQDYGVGISEQEQQYLFRKFARLSPRPTANEHSTGLGLFIVRKLAEMMNGRVWCQSQVAIGSTFVLEIPRKNQS